MKGGQVQETRAVSYALEVSLKASRSEAWSALTEEIGAWWLSDFHMLGEGSTVSLDARAGGQLVEQKANGGSLLWYTVQWVQEEEVMSLVGHLAPGFGGPATSLFELRLEDTSDGCTLKVSDALVGCVTEEGAGKLSEGWATLFRDGLQRHLEGGE